MPAPSVARRRFVYLFAAGAPAWALITTYTGGVGWVLGPLRLSSREPIRPLLVGLAAAAYYVWRYARDEREADGRWIENHLARALPIAIVLIVVLGFVLGVHYGSFVAAGSDSYGYVSQARLWLDGTPRVAQPWVQQLSWPNREWVSAPLGYRPLSVDGTIVPTYPAGLPLVMALFLGLFGENGPFYVVPVFGALALWFTYLLGREATGSKVAGVLAALLLFASPVFLAHLIVPMSDVPAAAGWALVGLLVLKGTSNDKRPVLVGLVAGLTLLIRPNLVLLALMPAIAWHFRLGPLVRYTLGLAPALLVLAGINTFLHGSALTFGYGSFGELYAFSSAQQNLRNYGAWLVQTQTPLIALALLPFFVKDSLRADKREVSLRVCLFAVLVLTALSYVFYGVFDHWFYLRFLLPAYPAMFVLMAAAIRTIGRKLPIAVRAPVLICLLPATMLSAVRVGLDEGIFRQLEHEARYVRAAADVAMRTPATAVILAVQHSGSVRYYANRITLRYDWLAGDRLDAAIRDLKALGYQPFIVLDDWEEAEFRNRFAPHSPIGRLDWSPLVRVTGSPEVRIYDPEDRAE